MRRLALPLAPGSMTYALKAAGGMRGRRCLGGRLRIEGRMGRMEGLCGSWSGRRGTRASTSRGGEGGEDDQRHPKGHRPPAAGRERCGRRWGRRGGSVGGWTADTEAVTETESVGGEGREEMSIATWNITDGRCAGLESAGKALEEAGVDIAFVQDPKFSDDAYATKYVGPYTILTSATDRFNCGGVSLFYKAGSKYNLENGRAGGTETVPFFRKR